MSQAITFSYELDPGDFAVITEKLRDLAGNKANTYIARALNKTATTARVKLGDKAQASYTVKSGGFKKDMQIDKASAGNLVATIRSYGDTLDVPKFHWSPGGKSGVNIDVVKGGLKPIHKDDPKAFVMKVGRVERDKKTGVKKKLMRKNKQTGEDEQVMANLVFARVGRDRLPIVKIKSKSVPYMLGSENRVWGPTRPQIESALKKYMQQQIAALLG